MSQYNDVPVVELDEESVAPYGKVITPKFDEEPDIRGDNWQCWHPLGELPEGRKLSIGMVLAQPGDKNFSEMEKHPHRSEWVFAIDKPYIQPVALSHPGAIDKPNIETVKAFLIKPGQGVQISEGVWHAPGIAPGATPALYGFVLGEEGAEDVGTELGLVPFDSGAIMRCIV